MPEPGIGPGKAPGQDGSTERRAVLRRAPALDADATITLSRATLDEISLRRTTFADAAKAGTVQIRGNPDKLFELLGLLDNFDPAFPSVEPRPQ